MPKISLSTWSLFSRMSCQRSILFAAENGFEGIEIWSNTFDLWPRTVTAKEIENIKSIAGEYALSLAVHFCTANNNLADLNLGHLNESLNQLKETIRFCRRIGGRAVVIHPGTYCDILPCSQPQTNPKLMPEVLKQSAIERFKNSLKEAAYFAESHDVLICLENFSSSNNCILTAIEDMAEWIDTIHNPALKIALDLGHAHVSGGVARVISILGDRIAHLYVHDNDADSLSHRELGTGTTDWQSIRPFLKSFPGMLSIEVMDYFDPEGAILRSKSFLDRLLAAQ
jgi:sugar phosphate isomerase/epimerase